MANPPLRHPYAWDGAPPPDNGGGVVTSIGLGRAPTRLAIDPSGTVPEPARPPGRLAIDPDGRAGDASTGEGPRVAVGRPEPTPDPTRSRPSGRMSLGS